MEYYRTKACLIAVMLCGFSGYTFSEGIITEEDLLAEIDYVSGVTHLKQDLEQVPAAVTIIDRRTIESSTAVDLVDVFRLIPGFQVYFHHGNKPGVTYHVHGGQYSRRLEVKIDGRSVYEPLLSSVEWNTLGVELDDIEYIEVVRGSNTSADGSNAFLASINIVTRSPLASLGTQYGFNYGSQGIKRGTISHSSQLGQLVSRATIKVSENDGFSGIDDSAEILTMRYQGLWTPTVIDSINFQVGMGDTETTVGPSDYSSRHWKNNFQHLHWKRITNEWSDMQFSLYHNAIDFEDASELPLNVLEVLGYWGDFGNGSLAGNEKNTDEKLSPTTQAILYAEPDKEGTYIVKPSYSHFSDRWDADIRSNIYLWNDFRVNLGLASRYDSFETELYLGGAGKVSQVSNRMYANFEWLQSEQLTFNYGHVFEKRRDLEGTNSFRLAANYQLSKQHMFRVASSKSYREPSLLEANQKSAYTYDGIDIHVSVNADDDISKESLESYEIGYLGSFFDKSLNLDIRFFDEDLSNLIGQRISLYSNNPTFSDYDETYTITSDNYGETQLRKSVIDNIEDLRLKGFEWQLQYTPTNKVFFNVNYSHINVSGLGWYGIKLDRIGDDEEILIAKDNFIGLDKAVPENMVNILTSYKFNNGIRLSGSYHYKSSYQSNVRREFEVESYNRIDIKASKRWFIGNNWIQASFTAQNVGSDYSEQFSFNKFESKYILGIKVGSN